MFEYGNLKFIQNEDKNSWYFVCKEDDKYTEKELGKGDFLVILNSLGEENWELVSIDEVIGFVLKRRLGDA